MKKRLQEKRAAKGPTKAQLQRSNAALKRKAEAAAAQSNAISKANTEAVARAEGAKIRAERQRDMVLQILTEVQPELADLLVREARLQFDPGFQVIRRPHLPPISTLIDAAAYCQPNFVLEHFITRARMWVETEQPRGRRLLCFRLQRPPGKDTLAWQHAFDDEICHRSPTAIRWMIKDAAERLCAELTAKLAR